MLHIFKFTAGAGWRFLAHQRGVIAMRKLRKASIAAILLALLAVGTAFALTIVVDGVREAAWDAGAGDQADPNESGVTNEGVDITRFQWTNDTSNFYFLIETSATTDWNRVPLRPYIWICVNNDNDILTGTSFPGVCLESGYDQYIQIEGPIPLTVSVFDENFNPVAATTSAATVGTITEVSIDLAALGFDGTNCGLAPMGVYMDGRTLDPDDNVTDQGDVPVTCGVPTAINLQSFHVTGQSALLPLSVATLVLALLTFGYLVYRKQRRVAG
jgi:hypothetical protein